MWATLVAIYKHHQLQSRSLAQRSNIVAFPGLGTGIDKVTIDEAARQISLAYQNFLYRIQNSQSFSQAEFQDLSTLF